MAIDLLSTELPSDRSVKVLFPMTPRLIRCCCSNFRRFSCYFSKSRCPDIPTRTAFASCLRALKQLQWDERTVINVFLTYENKLSASCWGNQRKVVSARHSGCLPTFSRSHSSSELVSGCFNSGYVTVTYLTIELKSIFRIIRGLSRKQIRG